MSRRSWRDSPLVRYVFARCFGYVSAEDARIVATRFYEPEAMGALRRMLASARGLKQIDAAVQKAAKEQEHPRGMG